MCLHMYTLFRFEILQVGMPHCSSQSYWAVIESKPDKPCLWIYHQSFHSKFASDEYMQFASVKQYIFEDKVGFLGILWNPGHHWTHLLFVVSRSESSVITISKLRKCHLLVMSSLLMHLPSDSISILQNTGSRIRFRICFEAKQKLEKESLSRASFLNIRTWTYVGASRKESPSSCSDEFSPLTFKSLCVSSPHSLPSLLIHGLDITNDLAD